LSPAALVGALSGSGTATIDGLQISGFDPKAIESALRAAEHGVALDAIRIGDIVRTALDTGRLHIPALSGAITIEAGRTALAPLAAPAEGADVAIAGSYDLGADALDLRFGLAGPRRTDAPGGQRPEISIALKGPLDAPRRTVDVAPLVNWLTMRAVEQEAKRLEAAEQEAQRIQAQEAARRLAAAEEAKRAEAIEEARRAQAQETAAPASTAGAPSFDKLPDLPAPIEIRPLPARTEVKPRRPAPRAEHTSTMAAPLAPAPLVITPPDPRQ
jgi:large subunit ribosomal protein L24